MSFAVAFTENCTQMMAHINIEMRFYYDLISRVLSPLNLDALLSHSF